jgi:hypothetical protein
VCYIVQDDITNGHLTPKQKKLVEDYVYFSFFCSFTDINQIQEDVKNGTTTYLCASDNPLFGGASRTFNQTDYPYTFNMRLELPSGHFVLNAQEQD